MAATPITVIGAGIIGLTTAVRLAEAGFDVAVIARDLPLETTSAVAAALWYPYRAGPPDQVLTWARTSFWTFLADADVPDSGVALVEGLELRSSPGLPWFSSALPDVAGFRHIADVPPGYNEGWQMRLPVIEPRRYLPRLVRRLESLGGSLTRMAVTHLPDHSLIVNCSGLASRALADDLSVTPVRGQVVRVERVAGVDAWLLDQTDEEKLVYVVPRANDVVVGGTATVGEFDQASDPQVATAILERAVRLVPPLAGAAVLGTAVGLRPARPTIRVATTQRPSGGTIIHNYGHGGAGWTVAWGCAAAVVIETSRLGLN